MAAALGSGQYASGSYNAQGDRGGAAIVNVYEHVSPRPVDPATLAATLERLTALSLDAIPGVAPLPAGSCVLLSPDPHFVGREAELRTLASALKGDPDADNRARRQLGMLPLLLTRTQHAMVDGTIDIAGLPVISWREPTAAYSSGDQK